MRFRFLLLALAMFVNTNKGIGAESFEYAGTFREASSRFDLSINNDRHVELSSGSWVYTRPLIRDDDRSFHGVGYYMSSGCQVPVQSFFDFGSDGQTLSVEFQSPHSIFIGPFGGCNFIGQDIERYQLTRISEDPNSSWSRNLEGRGCARVGARNDLNQQSSSLDQQCRSQGGISQVTSDQIPFCTEPDPNDLSCSWGYCTLRGHFTCNISTP